MNERGATGSLSGCSRATNWPTIPDPADQIDPLAGPLHCVGAQLRPYTPQCTAPLNAYASTVTPAPATTSPIAQQGWPSAA